MKFREFAVTTLVMAVGGMLAVSAPARAEGAPAARQLLEVKCAACHQPQAGGKLDGIEFVRKTPEAWRMNIERMERINKVKITGDEVETLVKYLSDEYGLAPAEVEPYRYALERRWVVYEDVENPAVKGACTACHSYGRAALERRTPEMWARIPDFKLGLLPLTELQVRLLGDDWYNVAREQAVPELAKAFPFDGADWKKWKAQPKAKLGGTWAVVGYDPGVGEYVGEATVEAAGEDQYRSRFAFTTEGGRKIAGKSEATVYTGFQWRGEGTRDDQKNVREIFFVTEDGNEMRGRRLQGFFGDVGGDETFYRVNGQARVLSVLPRGLKSDGKPARVTIFGTGLDGLGKGDLALGAGVEVRSIVSSEPTRVVADVVAAPDAAAGARTVRAGKASREDALVVYRRFDYVQILPGKGMVYASGVRMPKLYQQFEAVGFLNGADGAKGTEDDVRVGRVSRAQWRIEEYYRTAEDDDAPFVGSIDQNGLFTPANDAPNPNRHKSESNEGDVWVRATIADGGGESYEARAYLLVMPARFVFPAIR